MDDPTGGLSRDDLYREVAASYGAAITRLARGYLRDPERARDLVQDIHVALWLSLGKFQGRCSLRTWVYRVAHNTATSKVLRPQTNAPITIRIDDDLESIDLVSASSGEENLDRQRTLDRLYALIQGLRPPDRQIILLYLEGLDAASIAEITGISAANVATKVRRIKDILVRRFHQRVHDEQ